MPRLMMNHDGKETAIEFVRATGILKSGAKAAGVTYQTLRNEIRRSPIFAKRIYEAQQDGKAEVGDKAVENIKELGSEKNRDVRSRLTANLALANWAVPGFRGESKVTGTFEHNIRIKSAIPRPRYAEVTEVPPKQLEQEEEIEIDYKETKLLTAGKKET